MQRLRDSNDDIFLAKRYGFSNAEIAQITGKAPQEIEEIAGAPSYKMVDTCAAEFPANTPYFYSTYEPVCEIVPTDTKKVLILGSGPIRIGQGIEFDYCTVHAVQALREEEGVEVHIVNNNPETVSTDFDTSDRLFFEPMQLEDIMNILKKDRYYGVMVQFGGQNAVNLAVPIEEEINTAWPLNPHPGYKPRCHGYCGGPRPVQRPVEKARISPARQTLRHIRRPRQRRRPSRSVTRCSSGPPMSSGDVPWRSSMTSANSRPT